MTEIAQVPVAAAGVLDMSRIAVSSGWRLDPPVPADRDKALGALIREAQEWGADSVADIVFAIESCRNAVCEGVTLQRLVATGRPVRGPLG